MRSSTPAPAIARIFGLIAAVGLLVAACSTNKPSGSQTIFKTVDPSSPAASSSAPAPASSSASRPPAAPVHIKLLNSDGSTYGVGMPVIAFFSKKITSAKALQQATKATVNGKPVAGGWYFEYSSYYKQYPIEAHWRPQNFWPAHSHVHIDIPTKGLSAGTGLAYDDSLTSDFATGPENVGVINDATHTITITSDGHEKYKFPVSLGSHKTPTTSGIKVIMEKGLDISMRGPGYYDPHVKFTQRLTYSGEYLHAAPWNTYNINHGIDSSNGCTNLHPTDAKTLYSFLRVGDVMEYPNANGKAMTMGAGYGDWNVSWAAWQTGGLVPTT